MVGGEVNTSKKQVEVLLTQYERIQESLSKTVDRLIQLLGAGVGILVLH